MKRRVFSRMMGVVLACLVGLLITATPQSAQAELQPRMRAGLKLLKAARAQLHQGSHDKGGHRVKAIKQVNLAIAQVKRGIHFDNKNKKHSVQLARQPRMKAALGLLRAARKRLKRGSHDKGGHRVKALVHVNLAIAQVKKGIHFDNKH